MTFDKHTLLRALPPATATLYPALVAAGPAISPLFLLLSLAVPALALWTLHRQLLGDAYAHYPLARVAALLTIAAPPLYTLLGGQLDFRPGVSVRSSTALLLFYSLLASIAFRERPAKNAAPTRSSDRLARAHGYSALLLTLFGVAHLFNHLLGFISGDLHLRFMNAARLFQCISGLMLVRRRLAHQTSWFETLQLSTGFYLALFLIAHLAAVLTFRAQGVDTNWIWLKRSNLLADAWPARLVPYYFLAVVAFGVHGTAGVRQVLLAHQQPPARVNRLASVLSVATLLLATMIMAALIR